MITVFAGFKERTLMQGWQFGITPASIVSADAANDVSPKEALPSGLDRPKFKIVTD